MLVKDLTDEQQETFTKVFYECWDDEFDFDSDEDSDSPAPWGCPWYSCDGETLVGDTVEEMAKNFFLSVKDDILECSKTW